MNWIKEKCESLLGIFVEFPRVFILTVFYVVAALVVMLAFFLVLHSIATFNLMGTTPFYNLIADNYHILKWGFLAVPAAILLWGWADAEDLYLKLRNRKYRF